MGDPVTFDGCYDGDTCDFEELDESVRLARIDTPEMYQACHPVAERSKAALSRLLRRADQICIEIEGKGVYDRYIGELYADGRSVSDFMLSNDHAVEYGRDTCDREPADQSSENSENAQCPENFYCSDLATCEAAKARHEKCGDGLDADGDGVPCENLCGK